MGAALASVQTGATNGMGAFRIGRENAEARQPFPTDLGQGHRIARPFLGWQVRSATLPSDLFAAVHPVGR